MKKSSSRNSESSTVVSSPRYQSPHSNEAGDPPGSTYASPAVAFDKSPIDNTKAIVAVDKHGEYTPILSRLPEAQKSPESANHKSSPPPRPVNRAVKEEDAPPAAAAAEKAGGRGGREEGRSKTLSTILRRSRSREMVKRAGLGFRMSEMILCLISFSVMAADKTQGWSGDSFDRYKEYRCAFTVGFLLEFSF